MVSCVEDGLQEYVFFVVVFYSLYWRRQPGGPWIPAAKMGSEDVLVQELSLVSGVLLLTATPRGQHSGAQLMVGVSGRTQPRNQESTNVFSQ